MERAPPSKSTFVVGTGIRTVGQLTIEAIAWIQRADKLLYVVADASARELMQRLNPRGAESLACLYIDGQHRGITYEAMVERILSCVREGMLTCVAAYGHPGVFGYPGHEAIRRARAEGYLARMLPAISAEDCLFADLGIDPGTNGCQSYEATDFLINSRKVDPTSALILWQIGVVGELAFRANGSYELSALPLLTERLCQVYRPEHTAYLYEAAVHLGCEPVIRTLPIGSLPQASPRPMTTLYVPPAESTKLDEAMYNRVAALKSIQTALAS
jgi:uncharacterized protein YabN with tetrapyrrole methylase and pyrophosphatase domain